jgi:hypothetical protein
MFFRIPTVLTANRQRDSNKIEPQLANVNRACQKPIHEKAAV